MALERKGICKEKNSFSSRGRRIQLQCCCGHCSKLKVVSTEQGGAVAFMDIG
jgi:hypothetical protein